MAIRLCFLFSLFCFGLSAQTLTQAFNEPSISEVDINYALDTSDYTTGLPTAVTGSNVVWDFTKLKGKFPVIFDSIVSPAAVPGASNYPAATYVQKRGDIYSFFRSESGPQQTEFLGAFSPVLSITFTNSAIVAVYPVAYGFANTDAVSGNFKYNNYTGGCKGDIKVTADGIGTVNFPNGVSFQNVLRLKSVEQVTMSTTIPVGSIDQSIYSYYAPGKKYPILTVQYQRYELIVGTPTITALAYGNYDYFTVAGLHEQNNLNSVSVYPNPFSDKLTVKTPDENAQLVFNFYSTLGSLVFTTESTGDITYEELPAGVYLLEIRSENNSAYRKLVRQ